MTFSSRASAARRARNVDDLIAAEWALEDLQIVGPFDPDDPRAYGGAEMLLEDRLAEEAAERERELADAFARGVEEGRVAGEIAEAARLRHALAAAEQVLEELREGEERWVGTIEENVCALSVAIARQIMDRELKMDQTIIGDLVRRALSEFPIDQPLRVRLNPLDLVAINSIAGDEKKLTITAQRDVNWIADGRVAQGGCMVEGRDRIIDGRVDTAMERLYRRLTYAHV